jgi:hypothetical protein
MKKTILRTYREELSLHERLEQELSAYPEKTIHTDGSINVKHVNNPYFLVNDKWNVDFIGDIKQFKKEKVDQAIKRLLRANKSINFNSVSEESGVSKASLYNHSDIRERK